MRPLGTGVAAVVLAVALAPSAARAAFGLTTSATPGFGVTLNGTDLTGAWTVPSTVTQTNTGASGNTGWNLTMTSTTFATTSGAKLSATASSVVGVSAACTQPGNCTNPVNSMTYPIALPSGASAPTAVKVYNAATSTGKGVFTVTPDVRTTVAADRDAGSYKATVTLTLVSGP